MKYLFIHNNYPAQFSHAVQTLANKGNDIVFLSNFSRGDAPKDKIRLINIPSVNPKAFKSRSESHGTLQEMYFTGESFGNAMMSLRNSGFIPDAICAHPGWGGATYVRDIFPDSAYIVYCEWFYTKGELYNFFSKEPKKPRAFSTNRIRNIHQLNALQDCDIAISPTSWQQAQYPVEFSGKIRTLHDGIDMDYFSPSTGGDAVVQGVDLNKFDEIVTYTTRGMEPYRGFPQFFRSIPLILEERPKAHVVIMGKDASHYSPNRPDGRTWLSALKNEIKIDWNRVHILNFGSYEEYRKVLRASTVHAYLTVPFVLSWSLLEAMSCKCLVVASATSPVQEVIRHGYNGFLTSFWSSEDIAKTIINALQNSIKYDDIRTNARVTVSERYNLEKNLPLFLNIISDAINKRKILSAANV